MKTDQLVRTLVADGAPIRRLESADRRCVRWLGWAFALVIIGAAVLGLRFDLASKAQDGFFLVENGVLLLLFVSAAWCAFQMSVPNDQRGWASFLLPLLAWSAWLSSVLLRLGVEPGTAAFDLHAEPGLACIARVLALGALPVATCLMAIRRAAPQSTRLAGALVSLAAFSVAEVGTQTVCRVDHPGHVLLWHVMPVLALTGVGACVGELALKRRPA